MGLDHVHVHAPLNLTQDRRGILLEDRLGDQQALVDHNKELLRCSIPGAFFDLLWQLSRRLRGKGLGCTKHVAVENSRWSRIHLIQPHRRCANFSEHFQNTPDTC